MHQAHAKIYNYHTCMQLLHTACHIDSRHAKIFELNLQLQR